jgi:hypothetical protein
MNIVCILKEQHTRTRQAHEAKLKLLETEALLNEIPESPLSGIEALPIELWSAIIERGVALHLNDTSYYYPWASGLRHDMGMRLACRKWCSFWVIQLKTETN